MEIHLARIRGDDSCKLRPDTYIRLNIGEL
jgi:hypothetical protein